MWRHNDDRSSCYRPCWPAWPGVVPGIPGFDASLLQHVIHALLSAEADTVCGAQWGQQDPQRHTRRNVYRYRPLDTRVGTIDVAIPKLRSGTSFPEWLLQRRKLCDSALITVVARCYLAGVSTRRMDKLKAVTRNGSGADSWRYLLLLEVQRLNTCGVAD